MIKLPTKMVKMEMVDPQEVPSGEPELSISAAKTSRDSSLTPIATLEKAILNAHTSEMPLPSYGYPFKLKPRQEGRVTVNMCITVKQKHEETALQCLTISTVTMSA